MNADTFAGHLAARLGAGRFVIAGTTAGVLDDAGATLPALDPPAIERLIGGGTATAGMVAKFRACADAVAGGVSEVVIVNGRDQAALEAAALGRLGDARATRDHGPVDVASQDVSRPGPLGPGNGRCHELGQG